MTFKLNQNKSYKYPVVYHYIDDDGITKNCKFKATYKRLSKAERKKALTPAQYDEEAGEKDLSLLEDVLVSWEGVVDEENKEIPYSVENLREIDDQCPEFTAALAFAWLESIKKISEKNSKQ